MMLKFNIHALILCFLVPICAYSHTTNSPPEGAKKTVLPTHCHVGIDLFHLTYRWYQEMGNMVEGNFTTDFGPLLFYSNVGYERMKRNGKFPPITHGQYYKLGLAYNFLTPTKQHNHFFLGVVYAKSFFDFCLKVNKLACNHEGDKSCTDRCKPILKEQSEGKYPSIPLNDSNTCRWWEVIIGSKVSVIQYLSIGCTFSYKFWQHLHDSNLEPYDVPGWGLKKARPAFGYNFYILAHIPFRKTKP